MTQADRSVHLQEPVSNFHKFFECWIAEQNQYLQQLVSFSKEHEEHQRQHGRNGRTQTLDETTLDYLVLRVLQHYELYYRAKSMWAKNDILSMFNPTWRSTLEDAFLWIGGWRPSTAFHLLHSKLGLQLEALLEELIRGLTTGNLDDLSPIQLEKVDELHKETIKEEKEIDEKLAAQQEKMADASMVELTHTVTEMMREEAKVEGDTMEGGRVDSTLTPKEEGLVGILQMADDLRLKTLKKVIDILSPIQGVYFLIAAAELHLRVHEWGKKRDADNQVGEVGGGHGQHD